MSQNDRIIRFRTHTGHIICDELHTQDYNSSASFKKIRAGTQGVKFIISNAAGFVKRANGQRPGILIYFLP